MRPQIRFLLGDGPPNGFTVEVVNEGWGCVTPSLFQAARRAKRESAWRTGPVLVRGNDGTPLAAYVGGELLE